MATPLLLETMNRPSKLLRTCVRWVATSGLLLVLAGCSSFEREWRKTVAAPASMGDVQGAWEGVWLSDVNHHTGRLRCLLTPIDEHSFKARFHATYAKVIQVGYSVKLAAVPTDTNTLFRGNANLGWIAGGVYEYAGHATPANFFSTYRCKYDHGTFELRRPP